MSVARLATPGDIESLCNTHWVWRGSLIPSRYDVEQFATLVGWKQVWLFEGLSEISERFELQAFAVVQELRRKKAEEPHGMVLQALVASDAPEGLEAAKALLADLIERLPPKDDLPWEAQMQKQYGRVTMYYALLEAGFAESVDQDWPGWVQLVR